MEEKAKGQHRADRVDKDEVDFCGGYLGPRGGSRRALLAGTNHATERIQPSRIIFGRNFGRYSPQIYPPRPPRALPTPTGQPSDIIHFPDELESSHFYWGFPSVPVLLARSAINSYWEEPYGPEAYSRIKEFRSIPENHAIHDVWEANLAFKVHAVLESHGVEWTSTDIACFGWKDDDFFLCRRKSPSCLTLWIGVMKPEGFDEMNTEQRGKYVREVAQVIPECLALLHEYGIDDVDVEIRHSAVTLCGQLQAPLPFDPAPDKRLPFTTAIGHTICSKDNIKLRGTGGFFVTSKGDPNRLLLVTARHVLFPEGDNRHFNNIRDNQPRHNVVLVGGNSDFEEYLSEIEGMRRRQQSLYDDFRAKEGHSWKVDAVKSKLTRLESILRELNDKRDSAEDGIFGHVILSPPHNVFPIDCDHHHDGDSPEIDNQEFDPIAEDWAVIEVDSSRINASNFKGNVLDLGEKVAPFVGDYQLFQLITALKKDDPTSPITISGVKHLLQLSGCVPDESYSKPTQVLKRGHSSRLNVGRSTGIPSYFRVRRGNAWSTRLKALPVYPFMHSSIFAKHGDSGSAVVDRTGRIFGLFFAGASSCRPGAAMDVSFVMPVKFLRERMEQCGLHDINFEPILTQ
ncbi:hypothetical protein NLI96_g6106 [Meripilus lineatus]|uniref:Serine protease n=1 Tax=Meripilus lineatus TaxID=2056292 RepID=A0AAD5YE81_9APHY|nr:hypothetical protein NLI96_g6106 [Physisporinus lineatus]